MSFLAIDIGNTRLKWALFDTVSPHAHMLAHGAVFLETIDHLAESDWKALPAPTRMLGCVVAGEAILGANLFKDWLVAMLIDGDAYTVADPYLFTFAGWLESDGVDIAEFPRVQAHFERMKARPAVQRALSAKA